MTSNLCYDTTYLSIKEVKRNATTSRQKETGQSKRQDRRSPGTDSRAVFQGHDGEEFRDKGWETKQGSGPFQECGLYHLAPGGD